MRPWKVLLAVAMSLPACTSEDDACRRAADHLNQCFGQEVAATPTSCDADAAERILASDCEQLFAQLNSGKSDVWETLCSWTGWFCPEAPAPASPAEPQETRSVALGQAQYALHCKDCHGPTGLADGPAAVALSPRPANLTLPATQSRSDADLFMIITQGRAPMPSWASLSETKRWSLVDFIRTLRRP